MCGFLSTITGFLFWRKMYFRVLIYKKRSWVGKSVNGLILIYLIYIVGSSGGSAVKGLSANTRDLGLIPGSRKCPGEGNGNPLQYSCLVNPMVRGAWLATIHVVAKSQTWNNSTRYYLVQLVPAVRVICPFLIVNLILCDISDKEVYFDN